MPLALEGIGTVDAVEETYGVVGERLECRMPSMRALSTAILLMRPGLQGSQSPRVVDAW